VRGCPVRRVAGDAAGLAAAQCLGLVGADAVFDDAGAAVVGGGEGSVDDDREVRSAAGAEGGVVESGVLGVDAAGFLEVFPALLLGSLPGYKTELLHSYWTPQLAAGLIDAALAYLQPARNSA
jgi:hypothetical protein